MRAWARVEAIDPDRHAVIVTDHGNAELMVDPATGGPHPLTTNPVPLILVDPPTTAR
jgi:2,3-bisphosphoglycerate-independent phosphoglycerate mutase